MYCVGLFYICYVIQLHLTNQGGSIAPSPNKIKNVCCKNNVLPRPKPYMKFFIWGTTITVNSL